MAYATRLREKDYDCDFGDNTNERILEHLIQIIENEFLIQRCISKGWTLQQFLAEAGQTEDISRRVVVALLFYVHGKHLMSCRDGQLTKPHFSLAGLDLLSG